MAVTWHEFRETETVHGRTLEVERGSCSLVIGLSGLDRGGGWTSPAMAGARGADIEARSSVDRDAASDGRKLVYLRLCSFRTISNHNNLGKLVKKLRL